MAFAVPAMLVVIGEFSPALDVDAAVPVIVVEIGELRDALDVADANPEIVVVPRSKLAIDYPFSSP